MTVLVTGGAGYIGSHMVSSSRMPAKTSWSSTICRPASAGPCPASRVRRRRCRRPGPRPARRSSEHGIDAIIHFAGSIVVPEFGRRSAGLLSQQYRQIARPDRGCGQGGVQHFIFSSTAAVYGNAGDQPVVEDAPLAPISPYGTSKLHDRDGCWPTLPAPTTSRYVALRYFNVAGADPQGPHRPVDAARHPPDQGRLRDGAGKRGHMEVFGTDYPTPDGTCVRDYIHVTDLARAHLAALRHLRAGGASDIFNCGYGRGYSVLEVIEAVKRVSARRFRGASRPAAAGRSAPSSSPRPTRSASFWAGSPSTTGLTRSFLQALRWEERLSRG